MFQALKTCYIFSLSLRKTIIRAYIQKSSLKASFLTKQSQKKVVPISTLYSSLIRTLHVINRKFAHHCHILLQKFNQMHFYHLIARPNVTNSRFTQVQLMQDILIFSV